MFEVTVRVWGKYTGERAHMWRKFSAAAAVSLELCLPPSLPFASPWLASWLLSRGESLLLVSKRKEEEEKEGRKENQRKKETH